MQARARLGLGAAKVYPYATTPAPSLGGAATSRGASACCQWRCRSPSPVASGSTYTAVQTLTPTADPNPDPHGADVHPNPDPNQASTLARCARRTALAAHAAQRAALRPLPPKDTCGGGPQPPPGRPSRTCSLCALHTALCTSSANLHPVPPTPYKVVEYLRALLDATAATLSAAERAKVEATFLRAVDIEVAFFDNAYASA